MKKGNLIILSGPSGVGKGTVRKHLTDVLKVPFYYSISMTTRLPRNGEVDGVDYFFVTEDEFERNVKEDNFLEYASFVNHSYGTPKNVVDSYLDKGTDVLLEIETNGARQVMEKRPECISIFLVPPSFEALENRIRGRNSEDEATIQKRLSKARSEMALKDQYKYIVVNDSVETAAKSIEEIIRRGV